MSRFLKLVRIQNGSWQALPSDIDDHSPLTLTRNKNAPIDPFSLLNALANLLSPDGGINSSEEVPRLSSLMKKFSKKLVSRCVYCNVLRATKPEILNVFLNESGWDTLNNWLQDAKDNSNSSFLIELLNLCKALPMTVERLKQNNTARLIKSLTKFDNDEVRELSWELVKKWMTIVKGETSENNAEKKKKKKAKNSNDKEQRDPKEVEGVKSPTIEPLRVRTSAKRNSKDEVLKTDIYEDVKIDPEPLIKKPRIERPKTVKLFNKKFRATGLEEETPLPKNVAKKTPTVDKTVAVAVAKTAAVKRLNLSVPERITEKKLKHENLLNAVENSNASGGIKLIPAKPRPTHILHESASFIDALVAPQPPPQKRKKKVPIIKSPTTTTPPSPTLIPPKLQFYKETLGIDESENSPSKDSAKIDESSVEGKDDDPSDLAKDESEDVTERIGSPLTNDDKMVEMEQSIENEIEKEAKDQSDRSGANSKRDPTNLCSILSHGKRKDKKKTVRWQDDNNLKQIFLFDLDETERANVSHGQKFGDLKSIEIKREREAFETVRRLAGDKMEEAIPWWIEPIYIQLPPPLVDPGCNSKEKEIQCFRQQSILQEIYFTRDMVPESPCEPDLEICTPQEPKCIPLDDENHMGTIMDYSTVDMPSPKTTLPEVLTSLINIPSRRTPQPQHIPEQQVPVENVIRNQPHLPLPAAPAYEPEPMMSSGLLGVAPPSHIFNGPTAQENDNHVSNEWRPMEPMGVGHGDIYQPSYTMNRPIVIDHMHQQLHSRGDIRSRMNGPLIGPDVYHPNMGKGSHMSRPMGPGRGRQRTTPCRHFIAGGCRFGSNCNFLHPGVNGPLL